MKGNGKESLTDITKLNRHMKDSQNIALKEVVVKLNGRINELKEDQVSSRGPYATPPIGGAAPQNN